MTTPQPGIFAVGTRAQLHVELDVRPGHAGLPGALAQIREAATTVAGVNLVIGFGPRLWAELAPDQQPPEVEDFTPIEGVDGFAIPGEQHDLWLWFQGAGADAIFDAARTADRALRPCADVAREQPAFTYQASQDLTGFEDGTENPPIDEAAELIAIPDGPCAGGSVALVQRWVHDLDGFEELEDSDRELVIGRTLRGSVELDPSVQPPTSHVSRVVIEDDAGEELEVFRRSTAFGGVREHGLMFVAFSPDRARLQRMLERMAGAEDGVRDRLTEFSTPVASAWYVVPPVELLRALG